MQSIARRTIVALTLVVSLGCPSAVAKTHWLQGPTRGDRIEVRVGIDVGRKHEEREGSLFPAMLAHLHTAFGDVQTAWTSAFEEGCSIHIGVGIQASAWTLSCESSTSARRFAKVFVQKLFAVGQVNRLAPQARVAQFVGAANQANTIDIVLSGSNPVTATENEALDAIGLLVDDDVFDAWDGLVKKANITVTVVGLRLQHIGKRPSGGRLGQPAQCAAEEDQVSFMSKRNSFLFVSAVPPRMMWPNVSVAKRVLHRRLHHRARARGLSYAPSVELVPAECGVFLAMYVPVNRLLSAQSQAVSVIVSLGSDITDDEIKAALKAEAFAKDSKQDRTTAEMVEASQRSQLKRGGTPTVKGVRETLAKLLRQRQFELRFEVPLK